MLIIRENREVGYFPSVAYCFKPSKADRRGEQAPPSLFYAL